MADSRLARIGRTPFSCCCSIRPLTSTGVVEGVGESCLYRCRSLSILSFSSRCGLLALLDLSPPGLGLQEIGKAARTSAPQPLPGQWRRGLVKSHSVDSLDVFTVSTESRSVLSLNGIVSQFVIIWFLRPFEIPSESDRSVCERS
jgi:hypothetical protein